MRLIVALLAIVLMYSTANAAGLRMGPNDIRDNADAAGILAGRISDSLDRNQSGNGVIAGHPCATPNHYWEAIRKYHPSASLGSVEELPNYIRQLKYEPQGPSGKFPMSRILQKGSSCKLDLAGWTRSFNLGEGAWKDPNTGEYILAGDCNNVVGGAPPPPPPPPPPKPSACVEIPVAVLASYMDRNTVAMQIRPTLHVWGPRIAGCDLQFADCYCEDPDGKMAVAYKAAPITGSGVVRIPRELAKQMEKFCVMADGVWPAPPQGVIVSHDLVVRYIRPLASSGAVVVLPPGTSINFYITPQSARPMG